MQVNGQMPQNDLLKNLQNLLDIQQNNQNNNNNFAGQGQNFSQSMLGKAMNNTVNMGNGQ